MEKIHLTRHARRRMKWRKISLKEIKDTLTHSNKREKSPDGKINSGYIFRGKELYYCNKCSR